MLFLAQRRVFPLGLHIRLGYPPDFLEGTPFFTPLQNFLFPPLNRSPHQEGGGKIPSSTPLQKLYTASR